MEGAPRTIGLDRPLRLEWLDAAAGRLAAGDTPKEARDFVWRLLEGVVAGDTAHSARGKTLTVISRVWLTPPASAVSLRDRAVTRHAHASPVERLVLHWAMLLAVYPFFVEVTGLVGKSLQLNGDASLQRLARRLVETWGDRSTLRPAAQRLLRSLVQLGVLRDGAARGVCLAPTRRVTVPPELAEFLGEALLIHAQHGMPVNQVVNHPSNFAFDVHFDLRALRRGGRFQLHRQGDQSEFIELAASATLTTAQKRSGAASDAAVAAAGSKVRAARPKATR